MFCYIQIIPEITTQLNGRSHGNHTKHETWTYHFDIQNLLESSIVTSFDLQAFFLIIPKKIHGMAGNRTDQQLV